jgi:hypothetical protein
MVSAAAPWLTGSGFATDSGFAMANKRVLQK